MTTSVHKKYIVRVENRLTGEIGIAEIMATHSSDAQEQALVQYFREHGWRKARALVPEPHVPAP